MAQSATRTPKPLRFRTGSRRSSLCWSTQRRTATRLREIKYDSYRMMARLNRGAVKLITRTGLDWTRKYPAIAKSVAVLEARQALSTANCAASARTASLASSLGPAFELDRPHDPILLRNDRTIRRSEVFDETRIAGEGGVALLHISQVLEPP